MTRGDTGAGQVLGYFILSLFFFPLVVIMAEVVQDRNIQLQFELVDCKTK